MSTQTLARPRTVPIIPIAPTAVPDDLEEVDYPPEVIEEWDRIFEETKKLIASGELRPMTAAEFAAQEGIKMNG